MAEGGRPRRSAPPSLEQALAWVGAPLDESGGAHAARVEAVFADTESERPAWLLAKVGRFGRVVPIPFHDCAAVVGRVWAPYSREELRAAPTVDPVRPLTREQELEICAAYGIHEGTGRAQEVEGRPRGAVTSQAALAG
jgi:hypothetical protein